LAIIAPAISVCLINLAWEVLARPAIVNVSLSETLVFSLYVFSVVIGAIGSGIHSTSTSVYQTFYHEHKVGAFYINEKFHGALSHYMLYLGSIGCAVFLSLLELNHPLKSANFSPFFLILSGSLLGLLIALSITWSRFIVINLIASFLGVVILSIFASHFNPVEQFPFYIIANSFLSTLGLSLSMVVLCFRCSKRLERFLVLKLFPKGHPLRQSYS